MIGAISRTRSAAAAAQNSYLLNGTITNPTEAIRPSSLMDEGNYTELQIFYSNLHLSKEFIRRV